MVYSVGNQQGVFEGTAEGFCRDGRGCIYNIALKGE